MTMNKLSKMLLVAVILGLVFGVSAAYTSSASNSYAAQQGLPTAELHAQVNLQQGPTNSQDTSLIVVALAIGLVAGTPVFLVARRRVV